jgi:hypothetical protein
MTMEAIFFLSLCGKLFMSHFRFTSLSFSSSHQDYGFGMSSEKVSENRLWKLFM